MPTQLLGQSHNYERRRLLDAFDAGDGFARAADSQEDEMLRDREAGEAWMPLG